MGKWPTPQIVSSTARVTTWPTATISNAGERLAPKPPAKSDPPHVTAAASPNPTDKIEPEAAPGPPPAMNPNTSSGRPARWGNTQPLQPHPHWDGRHAPRSCGT